jgi:galactose mutarotase-like enzyme
MSLETQNYLDAVNHPEFPAKPSTILAPGKPLHEITVFKFSNS